MGSLLKLENVTKIFGGGLGSEDVTVALDDMTLDIEEGIPHIITVAGESGSGKTTMGMLMLGFYTPTEGSVLYRGKPLEDLSRGETFNFRREVQAVFQDPFAVYNPFYVVDNLLSIPIKNFGLAGSKIETREMMEEALRQVGLRPEETLGRYPHQLSGGQRQRISVARVFLIEPRFLIADEPVSMVDASLRSTILKSLRALNQDLGIPILYITHDLATAYHISDYIIILYQGSVMEAGGVEAIINDPKHPYTQLLVGSIPWPDPDVEWRDIEVTPSEVKGLTEEAEGCKFAPRCPHAMDVCYENRPDFFRLNGSQAAACFLYEKADRLPRRDLGELFKQAA